jgi:hypothetical protein
VVTISRRNDAELAKALRTSNAATTSHNANHKYHQRLTEKRSMLILERFLITLFEAVNCKTKHLPQSLRQ